MAPVAGVPLSLAAIKNLPNLRGKTVLIVPIFGLVFATAIQELKAALSHVGVSVQTCDGQANPSTVATCLSQAPSISGLAGVIGLGVPYQLASGSFATLAQKKIPVLIALHNPDGQPSGPYLAFTPTTTLFQRATQAADDYVAAKSGGKGNVLTLGLSEEADTRQQTADMTNYLKSICPACKVTQKTVQASAVNRATDIVSAQYLSNSGLNWIVSLNTDVTGQPVVQGLQSAGATNKVSQGGVANGILALQQISQGTARYAALIAGDLLSWENADALLRLIAHNSVPANYPVVVRLVDSSNIGSLKVTPAEASSFSWFGTANYHADFAKLWGAS